MIKNLPAMSLTIALAGALTLATAGLAGAQEASGLPVGDASPALRAQGPTDRAELAAFVDALLAQQMEENQIAGAAVDRTQPAR